MRRPVVVVAFLLFAGAPTIAAVRATAPRPSVDTAAQSASFQGGRAVASKPHAAKAVPGAVHSRVDSRPTERFLEKASSVVFDVRRLKGRVVKRERPELRE